MSDPTQMTLKGLAAAIKRRKVSSLEVTKAITSRQISIKANPFDLLKLRKLL